MRGLLADLTIRLGKAILPAAGWFALAYLGYWLALLPDYLFVPLVVSPLLGAPVLSWHLTAFRVSTANATLPGGSALATWISVLPLLLQIPFLVALVAAGGRIRLNFARIGLHFAGLWTILLIAVQVIWVAYNGGGQLGLLFAALAGRPLLSPASRIAATVAASLALLAAARICSGRLVAAARSGWLPRRQAWPALAVLILPMLLMIAGALNLFSLFRFLGRRDLLYLLIPVAACLIIALLGLTWKPKPVHEVGPSRFGFQGALAAVCVSAVLYAGLQQSANLRIWVAEGRLARAPFSHSEILYDPRTYSPAQIQHLAAAQEASLAAMSRRLNFPLDGLRLRIVLYPDLPSKRAATGTDRPYTVEGTTIRAVLGGYVDRLDSATTAAALLNAAWGRAGTVRMGQWVARWLAGDWRGKSLGQCTEQIEHEVGHYTLAQLLPSSSDGWLSPLIREPLGAAWVGTIFDQLGLPAVHKLHAAKPADLNVTGLARLLGVEPAALDRDWQQWTARTASQPATNPPVQRALDGDFFFRGVNFAYDGFGGRGGYASRQGEEQLRKLLSMGVNTVAVIPYGFARDPHTPPVAYIGSAETDEELTQALQYAHAIGMKVMLKPQLWVRGSFTGAVRFDDPAARSAWMRSYREFILHYARLAELEQFDLLCVGNELGGLTPYPNEWRRLIADVRRIYHGPLTYAANWGQEFESLAFWDALDFIGVNNYYPLVPAPAGASAAGTPRVEELLPGAERLAQKLEAISRKWNKPILFTEVGYPAVRGGASEPWIEDARRGVSLEEQAAAYQAVLQTFCGHASAGPWFRGMFWWKWPSSGIGGGPRDFSYAPLGKPAAEVLRTWFTRLAGDPKPMPAQSP